MKKEEFTKRYGEEAYREILAQNRAYKEEHREQAKAAAKKWREEHLEQVIANHKKYREEHPEEAKAAVEKWREENPEQVKANHQEDHRKGGKRYAKHLEDERTGLRGDRNKIRHKHGNQYRPYKAIIAPGSQLHHEWIPKTAEYRGVALVEKDQHMHGIVDVIEILDGKITLLTEEEIRNGGDISGRRSKHGSVSTCD